MSLAPPLSRKAGILSVFALLRQAVPSNQQFRNLSRRQITRNNRISTSTLPHFLLPLALSHSPFLLTAFAPFAVSLELLAVLPNKSTMQCPCLTGKASNQRHTLLPLVIAFDSAKYYGNFSPSSFIFQRLLKVPYLPTKKWR
jgi:hypothetical protein